MERLLDATARAETRHFWFRGLRRFVRPLLAEAVSGHSRPDILDCGCGTGANLEGPGGLGNGSRNRPRVGRRAACPRRWTPCRAGDGRATAVR